MNGSEFPRKARHDGNIKLMVALTKKSGAKGRINMEAVIILNGGTRDVVKLAYLILQAAKLFHTKAALGSTSKDDWDAILLDKAVSQA